MVTAGAADPRRDPATGKMAPTTRLAYPPPVVPTTASALDAASPAAIHAPAPIAAERSEAASEAAAVHKPGKSRLTLERVLGVTALSNAMMSVNPVSGEIAYAAGCIVVIYNLRRNKQVRYYRVDKCVSCLCFSFNGQYLAIGEKGYMPAITIWDGSNGALCAELQLHRFGVACMAFSRDGDILLSAGLVHDQHVYAWRLTRDDVTGRMKSKAVGVAQIQDKILGVDFCQDGDFFVTVGERHFKFWALDEDNNCGTTGIQINGIAELKHHDAEMPTKADATFTSVACGYGLCKLKTFAVTSDGTLCCFGASGAMERLVSLETPTGYAVSVTEAYIAVGGASSVVRLFDPTTLEYRATLPFPPAFGTAGCPNTVDKDAETPLYPDQPHRYPTTIAVRVSGSHVVALYSDRSIFIYDVSDVQSVRVERSFLFHCGSIRDMKVAGRPRGVSARGKLVYEVDTDGRKIEGGAASGVLPNGSFVTCSDDNTLRIWHLDLHKKPTAAISRFDPSAGNSNAISEAWKNPYSQEMLAVIYHDSKHAFEDEDSVVLGGCCSHQDALDIHSPSKDRGHSVGVRTVAIRPDQKHIAAGDSEGSILVAPLPIESSVTTIGAHSAEVHSVAYTTLPTANGDAATKFMMVSGGRDRLVQVYDCATDYAVASTLENHSGAVTTLKFSGDGRKLLSGGADKTIVFSDVTSSGKVTRINSVPFSGGKIWDFDVTSDHKAMVVACNNRLDLLDLSSCKQIKSHHVGEQHHIDVSPGNFCVAVSGSLSDKTIHIIDVESGETLASATGHGEAITSVRFTPDCRRLLSSSNDGCIFVWRLSDDIQSAIKSRLPRIVDPLIALPSPPKRGPQNMAGPPMLMPPPPPPPLPPVSKISSISIAPPVAAEPKLEAAEPANPPAKGSKKKGVEDKMQPAPNSVAATAGKGEPKPEATAWGGKKTAAPGPMSGIPMEDWMKTRESAKKSAVAEHSTSLERENFVEATDAGVVLAIDRSQTPDWARTAVPVQQQSKPSEVQGKQSAAQRARGKWSEHSQSSVLHGAEATSMLDYSYESFSHSPLRESPDKTLSAITEGDITTANFDGEVINTDTREKNQLLNLSVDALVLSSRTSLRASSSLAMEREHLEKRKKQIDTANAVAAMNMKLNQLGLLKTRSRPEERRSSAPAVCDQQEPPNSRPVPTDIPTNVTPEAVAADMDSRGLSTDSDSDDDPDDSQGDDDQSVGYDSSSSACSSRSDSSGDIRSAISESDDDKPPSIQGEGAEELPKEVNKTRPDIPPEMFESIDLSLATRDQARVESSVTLGTPPTVASPTHQPAVDQSLSMFTRGFSIDATSETFREADNEQFDHRERIPVDCSLSSFSSGYTGVAPEPTAPRQVPTLTVMASLSSLTAGYETQHGGSGAVAMNYNVEVSNSLKKSGENSDQDASTSFDTVVPVDCSVSAFTTGYSAESTVMPPVRKNATPQLDVAQSISAFTLGYAVVDDEEHLNDTQGSSADVNLVAASLSSFTARYESAAASAQGAPVASGPSARPAIEPLERISEELSSSVELRQSNDEHAGDIQPMPEAEGPRKFPHFEVAQSLSSFTVGYEADEPPKVEYSRPQVTEHPPAVVSTISALDEQLRSASRVLEEIPAADSPAKGAELERIQQLVGELRAAIRRLDAS